MTRPWIQPSAADAIDTPGGIRLVLARGTSPSPDLGPIVLISAVPVPGTDASLETFGAMRRRNPDHARERFRREALAAYRAATADARPLEFVGFNAVTDVPVWVVRESPLMLQGVAR